VGTNTSRGYCEKGRKRETGGLFVPAVVEQQDPTHPEKKSKWVWGEERELQTKRTSAAGGKSTKYAVQGEFDQVNKPALLAKYRYNLGGGAKLYSGRREPEMRYPGERPARSEERREREEGERQILRIRSTAGGFEEKIQCPNGGK